MRVLKQIFSKKWPEESAVPGDCLRTCVASVLDKHSPGAVPHFVKLDIESEQAGNRLDWARRMDAWLEQYGLISVFVEAPGRAEALMTCNLGPIRGEISEKTSNVAILRELGVEYAILGGKSPRGEHNHAVVIDLGGEIVCDPHPDNTGLREPLVDIFFFIPREKYPWPLPLSQQENP